MCRVFGCVAAEPVSIRHELLEAENPMVRQSEDHDSGWGMAVYERAEGADPELVRFPEAAYADGEFVNATNLRGRIFNVHVRRATMGQLALVNTHPFCLGSYTLGHNGTILRYPRLLEPGMREPVGDTDSEHLFNLLMHDFDDGDPVGCLRETMRRAVAHSPFSGLNILFSDGEKLFAYRLGLFDLHWLARPGQLIVASERVTDEPGWHSFWMKNCRVPLDILWLDASFRVVHVAAAQPPCPAEGNCPSIVPMRPARYALEFASGTAQAHGLKPGTRVDVLRVDGSPW